MRLWEIAKLSDWQIINIYLRPSANGADEQYWPIARAASEDERRATVAKLREKLDEQKRKHIANHNHPQHQYVGGKGQFYTIWRERGLSEKEIAARWDARRAKDQQHATQVIEEMQARRRALASKENST